ncbi:MAG: hypothetical protein WBA97_17360 [Actinophytocola sp.]|uniref:hypothetical protein n=1 Tax=Actinophytocola sp. TaxID=1872138 RepID=UPI003C7544B1
MTAVATEPKQATRNGMAVAVSVAAGILLAILWSYEFVDSVIGDNVANTLLGHEAKATPITGAGAGLLFAFVSGFAGTFTACNIAMAASIGPMSQAGQGQRGDTVLALLRPLGAFTAGMVTVSAVYGFVGVLLGDSLPQLSTAMAGDMPVRLIQSSVVFGLVGLAFGYLGLAALGVVRDVFADRPTARVVALGALVGAFLIGRPYGMFVKLFNWAAETGNPLYGAATFVLQSIGQHPDRDRVVRPVDPRHPRPVPDLAGEQPTPDGSGQRDAAAGPRRVHGHLLGPAGAVDLRFRLVPRHALQLSQPDSHGHAVPYASCQFHHSYGGVCG